MSPHYGQTPRGRPPRTVARVRVGIRGCLLGGMQGILVVLVPVLLAGFALLMDRFEARILAEPEQIET